MTAKLISFTYSCLHGDCKSDMTADGFHIRWVLEVAPKKYRTFNFLADVERFAVENGLTIE